MKKIFLALLAIVLCAFFIVSCEVAPVETPSQSESQSQSAPSQSESESAPIESEKESESSSVPTPPVQSESESESESESVSESESATPTFEIEASRPVFFLTQQEPIFITIKDGATVDTSKKHSVEIINSTTKSSFDLTQGDIRFTASELPGEITFKITIDGIESSNAITINVLQNPSKLAMTAQTACGLDMHLGLSYNIGIMPENIKFYEIVGHNGSNPEGILKINDKGRLEIIGAIDGRLSFNIKNTYTGENCPLPITCGTLDCGYSKAILTSLKESGTIQDGDCATHSLIQEMTYLNTDGIDLYGCNSSMLSYMPSLKKINVGDARLFFSSLSTPSIVEEITFKNNTNAALPPKVLEQMTSLKKLSVVGSFGCFGKEVLNIAYERIKSGTLEFEAFEGDILDQTEMEILMNSAFLTRKELTANLEANNGYLVPDSRAGYAIIGDCMFSQVVKVKGISRLDLYGGSALCSFVVYSECDDLTLNLYDFRSSTEDKTGYIPLYSSGKTLRINAIAGENSVYGANGTTTVTATSKSHENPKPAISAGKLYINVNEGASLSAYGGNGWTGWNGINGSDGNNTTEEKTAQAGGNGACGVFGNEVYILSNGFSSYGGKGGTGGTGGNGKGTNIFSGGYNGGDGGNGGTGGSAICYTSVYSNSYSSVLVGGEGGAGGSGGSAVAAGSNGDAGAAGSSGVSGAEKIAS